MTNSIGLIESKGLVALIEAADVILKNSPVNILGIHKLENGLVSLAVSGDFDYVKAAIEAGVDAGKRVGEIYSFSVIDNPPKQLLKLFGELFSDVDSSDKEESKTFVNPNNYLEAQKSNELNFEEPNLKPIIKSESKREKSKPLVVTKVDPIEKIKRLKEKANHSEQNHSKSTNKNVDDEKSEENKDKENFNPVSTIERLRLEALGLNKKNKVAEKFKDTTEKTNNEMNKINLALESKDIDFSIIDKMNVHKLRNYARKFPEFPIKGREISRANRDELVRLFKILKK